MAYGLGRREPTGSADAHPLDSQANIVRGAVSWHKVAATSQGRRRWRVQASHKGGELGFLFKNHKHMHKKHKKTKIPQNFPEALCVHLSLSPVAHLGHSYLERSRKCHVRLHSVGGKKSQVFVFFLINDNFHR